MSMRSWIRSLFTRTTGRPTRKAPHRVRLAVERLEDRTVPSLLTSTPEIQYESSLTGLDHPIYMAFDSAGDMYVAEDVGAAVSKFDPSGKLLTRWDIGGAATGIALDSSGDVYVSSKILNEIQVFTPDGAFLRSFGSTGSGNGQFNLPHAMAFDAADHLYVTENGNSRVQELDRFGNFIREWGTLGSGDGQFNFPQGIALDASGNVYVTDRNNDRVEKFDAKGKYLTQWNVAGNTAGVGVDAAGDVFVSNFSTPAVQVFTPDGSLQYSFGGMGSDNGDFNLAHGFAFDAHGGIWVADWSNGRVQQFASQTEVSGDVTTQAALNIAKRGNFNITISNITGLASGDLAAALSGAQFYLTVGGNLYAFDPTMVTISGSNVTITTQLKDSDLATSLATELSDNTSAATAVTAGLEIVSEYYTFTDANLTRLFSTAN
jgi:streptogramin lyase